jgi:hypothetical protein
VSGVAATSTAYGLQVAAASMEPEPRQGAGMQVTAGIGAVLGAAVVGIAVGL